MDESKKWWESKTIWGAVIVLVGAAVRSLGYDFGDEASWLDQIMALVDQWSAAVGGLLALYGRIVAIKPVA